MGLSDFIKRLFGASGDESGAAGTGKSEMCDGMDAVAVRKPARRSSGGMGADMLAGRLGIDLRQLQAASPAYRKFTIPKRSGGERVIFAPEPALKQTQRTILRRLLAKLESHPSATGFERGRSIVTNASAHTGSSVVLKMDLKDFFTSTSSARVSEYFTAIGWGEDAVGLLVRLCTHEGSLPQGAVTSPRLSNLVNYGMDARLDGFARTIGAVYTRYADDITFSFKASGGQADARIRFSVADPRISDKKRERMKIVSAIRMTKKVAAEYGYRLHQKRKLIVRRRHQSQRVTGLVVNDRVALPRETRRRLRAAKHHLATGRQASLTPEQLAGWQALLQMVETQREMKEV